MEYELATGSWDGLLSRNGMRIYLWRYHTNHIQYGIVTQNWRSYTYTQYNYNFNRYPTRFTVTYDGPTRRMKWYYNSTLMRDVSLNPNTGKYCSSSIITLLLF